MRHGKKIHKLERPKAHREALISNLASALITHGKIKTTEAKAKALKPVIDKLITTAKRNTVHARRLAARTLRGRDTLKKLFDEIAPGMLERTSGYSRIMRIGTRRGDGAQLVLVELITAQEKPEEKTKKGRKGWRKFGPRSRAEKKAKEPQEAAVAPIEETAEEAAQEEETSETKDTEASGAADASEQSASDEEKPQ